MRRTVPCHTCSWHVAYALHLVIWFRVNVLPFRDPPHPHEKDANPPSFRFQGRFHGIQPDHASREDGCLPFRWMGWTRFQTVHHTVCGRMAARTKRARVETNEDGVQVEQRDPPEDEEGPSGAEEEGDSQGTSPEETDEDEEDLDGEEEDDDHIDVDIEFYDPKEGDFLGIKSMLQLYLDGEPFNLSELVDQIIKQSTVGSVVKTGEDGDPIGIISVLNLHKHSNMTFVKELKSHLRCKCPDKESQKEIDRVFTTQGVGLILSERLLNCPPSMSAPLQDAIFDEIAWATEDEPTEELRKSFVFHEYLMISRVYQAPEGTSGKQSHNNNKGKGKPADLIFVRPEDEMFFECCNWYRTYPCARVEREGDLRQMRLVMTVPAKKVDTVRSQLHCTFAS